MSTLSSVEAERARKYESLIMQRLASIGQRRVAEVIGVSESTVSRMLGNTITQLCQMLPPLGLKVVPIEMQCYRPDDINPLLHLARLHLDSITSADQLRWED